MANALIFLVTDPAAESEGVNAWLIGALALGVLLLLLLAVAAIGGGREHS